jgi:flagellar motor switch/type III secretory pathway protein FliN
MGAAQTMPRPLPPPATAPPPNAAAERASQVAIEQALAPARATGGEQGAGDFGGAVARLPVELDVAVPVREFRVRNLLTLKLGEVIESQWASGEDLPLAAGEVQLAWSEFEVIDSELAVRITRLA